MLFRKHVKPPEPCRKMLLLFTNLLKNRNNRLEVLPTKDKPLKRIAWRLVVLTKLLRN